MPFINNDRPMQSREIPISEENHGTGATLIIEKGHPVWNPETEVIRFRIRTAGGIAPEMSDRDWLRAFITAIQSGILRAEI
jgi:hypothetical protein